MDENKIIQNILKNAKDFGKKDIRLYYWDGGTAKKCGSTKTGTNNRHFFNSVEECLEYLEFHKNKVNLRQKFWQTKQFLIVEYTAPFKSCILKIV